MGLGCCIIPSTVVERLARLGGKSPPILRTPRPATEPRNGPTRNFHEKYRKNSPRPEILDSQNLPPKYPENTKKYPENTENAYFWYFFGIFGVFSWGSRLSARGIFFRYFSWKFRVGPFRGSVAGRGVLNPNLLFFVGIWCVHQRTKGEL